MLLFLPPPTSIPIPIPTSKATPFLFRFFCIGEDAIDVIIAIAIVDGVAVVAAVVSVVNKVRLLLVVVAVVEVVGAHIMLPTTAMGDESVTGE